MKCGRCARERPVLRRTLPIPLELRCLQQGQFSPPSISLHLQHQPSVRRRTDQSILRRGDACPARLVSQHMFVGSVNNGNQTRPESNTGFVTNQARLVWAPTFWKCTLIESTAMTLILRVMMLTCRVSSNCLLHVDDMLVVEFLLWC